ncbi:MAG: hypothetical protein JXR48_04365 [Candidatus Delongbacteria bacterium]|nr:hypothetical protein [Candidatus Delongbacteria bacterium]
MKKGCSISIFGQPLFCCRFGNHIKAGKRTFLVQFKFKVIDIQFYFTTIHYI